MNPFDMLKNAKAIQEQIAKVQSELETVSVTGSAGGGIVKVVLNGHFGMTGIQLDPIAVDQRDIPMLQDLIVAAHADASNKVKELLKAKLGPMAAGMPGGFPGL
ncbi:YbaB/EbfC family nucleoid-associated protein [Treponema zuelzerae]|uniref:Nucleoid-associated protein K7J14_15760 n=1 Tax=Teretinema zuelzerae TaxID=156 RepID=A0AAE3JK71_9SPIR|nr:YbaB/EbfC family nucleoid-associated protein [Teretinema zuelzerae]MBN2810567.1 YbaB/EbfC family nucleoid-associated protein [Spirochaetales bacterium]MCD1656156.1 YbaB/EbfC family nucleoid-associated protein [Teretinema zuelzerae]